MTRVEVGDIYRAVPHGEGQGDAALVLVTAVDEGTGSASVTLLSPDVEFATPEDVLVPGPDSNRPYDLLVESDIFGYVWVQQLDRHFGRVFPSVLDDVAALRENGVTSRGGPVGPPVLADSDPRWAFKESELRRLQALTGDCTAALIGG